MSTNHSVQDPIIVELHAIRGRLAERFHNDLTAYSEAAAAHCRQLGFHFTSLPILTYPDCSRSDPRLRQRWERQAQAPLGDRLDQVSPRGVVALPAGIDDTGEQGKDP